MRQISIASFDILILKGKPVLHKKRKDCNGLVAMANSCMCLNQSAHPLGSNNNLLNVPELIRASFRIK